MVESQSDWADLAQQKTRVAAFTVDRLKQLIHRLNDECNQSLLRTGKKIDLVERIQEAMQNWKDRGEARSYRQAREIIDQIAASTNPPSRRSAATQYLPSPAASVPAAAYSQYSAQNGYSSPSVGAASSYPYPARPIHQQTASPYTNAHPQPGHAKSEIRFSASPFYKIVEPVSDLVVSQEAKDASERKNLVISFSLTAVQREKLTSPNSTHQLRLYCTSSTHYSTSSFGRVNPCPIEFPSTCEVRVNSTLLTANLRGLKKKPGTAPPADLGKTVRLAHSGANKLDMIFMNNQTPFVPKRFYAIVNLVEVTTVQQIVDRLRKGKYRSREDILSRMKQANKEDDDIVAGPASLSLKCPMSYVRIKTPCRSKYCVHSQCFDAESWFCVMEQTTTWLCPVCEKTLMSEDLMVDGYFESILQATPDSVDDVVVEADGEWHTSDNKFASPGWKTRLASVGRPPAPVRAEMMPEPTKAQSPTSAEVFVIDSDEEDDESNVKREVSPQGIARSVSYQHAATQHRPNRSTQDVIDLTLSDDEASPPPMRSKRPAMRDYSSSPPAAKRARLNSDARRPDGTSDWLSPTQFNRSTGGSSW